MSVIVYTDINNGEVVKASLEAVYYASKIASEKGGECIAVVCGEIDNSKLEALGNYGANKVVHNANNTTDNGQKAKLVQSIANANGASLVIFSHDFAGKAIAPRVAARMNAGIVSGAVELPQFNNGLVVKKSVFSGKAFASYKVNSEVAVISLLPNSIDIETSGASASVESDSTDLGDSRITVSELKTKGNGDKIDLTEAELVVSAGRGLKGPENWGMIEELAELLGAATACSRPVADIGWRPHHEHVGQTGIAIRPNLYIAAGISGAIQHLAGVNGSKVIVVINTDPEAPFFKAADYGIVGDAFEVVPKLVEAAKNFKA
ncbi:MAG: electron transfer flavoprotein subunit alpha [Crocinitomicaceae bacterium]|nr:electron transfer flavoprotein subunit alpha [Crocinitomicaceae bacterium]|tara:strand:+ start:30760 stop:31719 length:960 start_codon:yes stop_codon:yes gene_type:complete